MVYEIIPIMGNIIPYVTQPTRDFFIAHLDSQTNLVPLPLRWSYCLQTREAAKGGQRDVWRSVFLLQAGPQKMVREKKHICLRFFLKKIFFWVIFVYNALFLFVVSYCVWFLFCF